MLKWSENMIYKQLLDYYNKLIEDKNIEMEEVSLYIKTLTPEEAIGNPKRRDYPLLNGKEALIEANYKGSLGQAFSSARAEFNGRLSDISKLDIGFNTYDNAIFIAVLNALMKHFGLIEGTVHCKDEEPEECSCEIARTISSMGDKKVLLIGYQPSMIEALVNESVNLRVLDLNPENIGEERYGVSIEHGDIYPEAIEWCDIILCTGSTIVNGSIVNFLGEKPAYFYGTTIAGPAVILGLNRFCFKAE